MNSDIAWLAGLLEGEGHFGMVRDRRPGRRRPRVRVSLKMADKDVVERAASLMGVPSSSVGVRRPPLKDERSNRRPERWNTCFQFDAYGLRAERTMRLVRPYMGQRKGAKIDELLAMKGLAHHPKETTA